MTDYLPDPGLEAWLTRGGDARIILDDRGLNAYGYPPHPVPGLLAFGSSTASALSTHAYAAASALHQSLPEPLPPEIYAREWERIRRELQQVWGWDAALSGTAMIFGRSGSHIHLLASQLLGDDRGGVPTAVLADAGETGRFVPQALRGWHWDGIQAGKAITGRTGEVITVPVWASGGELREAEAIDADFMRQVSVKAAGGDRLLLVVQDVSKSGLILPGLACVLELKARYGERLTVLVDACQFRLARSTLTAYLQAGCMVALTGSKFLAGPAFSGLLLVPESIADQYREQTLPAALSWCSCRADWPLEWPGADTLENDSNRGLLLRWEAALAELKRFSVLEDAEIARFLERFSDVIQNFLMKEAGLEPLILPYPDRKPLLDTVTWDALPGILPFFIRNPGAGERLDAEQTMRIFRRLSRDVTGGDFIALGQPVQCGLTAGQPCSALRLALSAHQVVEGCIQPDLIMEQALTLFKRLPRYSLMD